MSDNNKKQSEIEFIPAICPKCGGELRVPSNKDVVKCMYCGIDVILHNPNKITSEIKIDVDKIFNLATFAIEAKNFEEAYKYFTQIIEHDPENKLAWFGKGYAAGMLSTITNLRVKEIQTCFKKGFHTDEPINVSSKMKNNNKSVVPQGEIDLSVLDEMLTEYAFHENSTRNPEYLKIAHLSYEKISDHISDLGKSIYGNDYDKWEQLILEVLNLRNEAYKLLVYDLENVPCRIFPKNEFVLSKSQYKGKISSTIKILIIIDKERNSMKELSKDSLVKRRERFVSIIKMSMPASGLARDNDINSQLNEYIDDAKKGCFIATATMGNPNHPYVITLRKFRDSYLIESSVGRRFVELYYSYSPGLAQIIAKNKILKLLSKYLIVKPLTTAARWISGGNL